MQTQNWNFSNGARSIAILALLAMSFATLATAQSHEDVRAILDSAAKEATNVSGVSIFAAPPKGFDPLKATNQELATYGLPQRPDQATQANAYEIWERGMLAAKHRADGKLDVKSFSSTNLKPVNSQGAAVSGQSFTKSSNWSGIAATNTNRTFNAKTSFDLVESVFNVPVAQPPFGACARGITGPFYEVSWNGIDGFSNGDVVQGGSLSAADCSGNTLYEAWVEWFPSYSILGVFYVHPGDDIWVQTYGYPGTSTQYVFVEDITLQTYGTYALPYVKGPGLVGNSAEWIVERPCCAPSGFPLALANTIYDFFAYDFAYKGNGAVVYAGSTAASTFNISMLADDGTTVIEGVYAGTAGTQGLESLWFVDEACAYSGGCTP